MAGVTRLAMATLLALAAAACSPRDDEAPPVTVADPTETDIWVAELLDSGRRLRVGTPVNVTDRPGYDNQPHFLPDGSGFLYTSIDANGQADIWRHEFDRGRGYRVTRTPEGEYSPTPDADGRVTVVRVEADGTQRLWRFDADGGEPALLLPQLAPVGYHAWLDGHTVGVFLLGEPPVLVVADARSGDTRVLLPSIGRSLHRMPGKRTLSAVHKASADEWNIVELSPDGGVPTLLAPALRPGEDFTWLPDGQLLMGRGAKLYRRVPGAGNEWHELVDFSGHGVSQITRVAVSPAGDRLAFVAQR